MFTTQSTMMDVFTAPEFREYQRFLMYNGARQEEDNDMNAQMAQAPLAALSQIGWSPEGIVSGLNFFEEAIDSGRVQQYFIYPEDECDDDPLKKDINFIRIRPAALKEGAPVIVLCAGGAYQSVCTMVEALPTARHMSDLGYEIFLFSYRVGVVGAALKALDDLGAGVKYLRDNAEELGIAPFHYAIGGYSAGANLISNWGAPDVGYKAYGLPKPEAMFPIYTFIDLKTESKRDEKGGLLEPMFGKNFATLIDRFNIVDQIDAEYPPCYIVCGKDDNTVPPINSELMKEKLDAAGVPAVLDEGEHAPHGFGDGTGTDVEGWPERAIAFLEGLK